jgi:5-methylcytosine-specific restriction endonuclease McrA
VQLAEQALKTLAKRTLPSNGDFQMSNFVFVLDTRKRPLDPIHPGAARHLLNQGKAAVFRRYPFTLILKEAFPDVPVQDLELKLDPGSNVTGIAVKQGDKIIFGAELQHRGQQIQDALLSRRQLRRRRRHRKTRYRKARFLNRTRPEGWLAPSLQHRVLTTMTWVRKFIRLAPVTRIAQELVRFDLQLMQNPEISDVQYQQGELQGYEAREYLLAKWNRKCAYCSVENVPFEVEHIQPRSKGGSDRVSNLTIACHDCNQSKGNQDVREFLSSQTDLLNRILKQAKSPLKDAAAVNSTRWALFNALKETGLPVTTGTGGRTKFNRTRFDLPKAHWFDAACVGQVDALKVLTSKPLLIAAKGHGTRQMCGTDKFGFPTRYRTRQKTWFGFQTGDFVRALVTTGKYVGNWVGRISVRARPSFKLASSQAFDVHPKYLEVIHRADGYSYGS